MIRLRSRNPMFSQIDRGLTSDGVSECTYTGVSIKTLILVVLAFASAGVAAYMLHNLTEDSIGIFMGVLFASSFVAFICVVIASLIPRIAVVPSIIYALSMGFFLGVLSALAEWALAMPGLAAMAVLITFTIFGVTLALYTSRVIRVGRFFRKFMMIAMFSLLVFMLIVMVSRFFTPTLSDVVFGNGGIGIAFSLIFILFGALMLIFDFDRIEAYVTNGADKKFEWPLALGLMVTLVWIYVEVLRLLIILASRRK
ncbi:MAG: Bax inhibitor-1/YccA family protein [Erysipelotrichales bacterium]|nr:Bax inhibitor-1/YccA family protein [Erysipelotrichales bacterium]